MVDSGCEVSRMNHDDRSAAGIDILDTAFAALRQQDATGAPPAVEAAVMAEWDAMWQGSGVKSKWRRRLVVAAPAAAAAAALIIIALAQWWLRYERNRPLLPQRPATVTAANAAPTRATDVFAQNVGADLQVGPKAARRTRNVRNSIGLRHDEGYAPSEFGLPLVLDTSVDRTTLHIVRVRMPRPALAVLGVIGSAETTGDVEVEVLVGDDGVARSIRRVSQWP
jgi:hypothetical protein